MAEKLLTDRELLGTPVAKALNHLVSIHIIFMSSNRISTNVQVLKCPHKPENFASFVFDKLLAEIELQSLSAGERFCVLQIFQWIIKDARLFFVAIFSVYLFEFYCLL